MMSQYEGMPDDAKVWIFQATDFIPDENISNMEHDLQVFLDDWVSHNKQFPSFAGIFYHKFVVFIADNTLIHIGGCSQDRMMHHIAYLENKYHLQLRDRTQVAYVGNDDAIATVALHTLKDAYESDAIHDGTLVFDNLVKTKREFDSQWKKPISQSWHKRFI